MGDRSNIVVEQHNGERIFLYGHWLGADAINVVRDVLARGERWGDESYLTRMLFNKLTAGDEEGSTGYGIATYMVDNDGYPLIVLRPNEQTVVLEKVDWETRETTEVTPRVSFEIFQGCVPEHANYSELAVAMGAQLTTA